MMLILAMDFNGICYYEILPEKETMNASKYFEFLKRLVNACGGNLQHMLWILDDNARPHRHNSITAWFEENHMKRWLQPSYSPHLSPRDYGYFHALKRTIGVVTHANIDSLKQAMDNEIRYSNANGKHTAIQNLLERWSRCINNKGEYL